MIPGTPALAGNKDTLSILPIKLLDVNVIRLVDKDDGVFKITTCVPAIFFVTTPDVLFSKCTDKLPDVYADIVNVSL